MRTEITYHVERKNLVYIPSIGFTGWIPSGKCKTLPEVRDILLRLRAELDMTKWEIRVVRQMSTFEVVEVH